MRILKYLTCAAVFSLVATSVFAAPAFVQIAPQGQNSGVASIPASFSGNVTSGNTLYVWGCWDDATATFTSIAKTSGTATLGSFNEVPASTTTNGNYHCVQGWMSVTGTGSLTLTLTLSATASGKVTLQPTEYSGVASVSPADVSSTNGQNSQSGTNAATSGSATTTQNGDLIAGFTIDYPGNASGIAAGTGFTSRTGTYCQVEDQVQSSAGSIAATFTYTGGTSDVIISGMLALKAASAAPANSGGIGGKAGIGGAAGVGF